jgi:hypothetical protein
LPQLRLPDPPADDGGIATDSGSNFGERVGVLMKCRARGVLQCSSVEAAVQQRPQRRPCRVAGGIHVIARALVRLQTIRELVGEMGRTVQDRIGEGLPESRSDEFPKPIASFSAIRCRERIPRVFE